MIALHIGGASAGTVAVTVIAIFFLVFAMSFAVGSVPEGHRRYSSEWFSAWFRASLPRIIIAGAFSALLFMGSALSSSGQSNADIAASCEAPLAPNTGNAVTQARLSVAVDGMRAIADAARSGDLQTAQALFVTNDAHNVAHDIDAPLRLKDNALARDLCESVLRLEREIAAAEINPQVLADEADAIALHLQSARESYDFGPPEPVAGGGVCTSAVGPATNDPLTESRIAEAAATLRQVADLAEDEQAQDAAQAFSGDAHNITHDIDGPLRVADADLAVEVCQAVVELESEFAGAQDAGIISENARKAADTLEEAGRAMGISG